MKASGRRNVNRRISALYFANDGGRIYKTRILRFPYLARLCARKLSDVGVFNITSPGRGEGRPRRIRFLTLASTPSLGSPNFPTLAWNYSYSFRPRGNILFRRDYFNIARRVAFLIRPPRETRINSLIHSEGVTSCAPGVLFRPKWMPVSAGPASASFSMLR